MINICQKIFKKEGNLFMDWFSLIHITAGLVVGAVLRLIDYNYGYATTFPEYMKIGIFILVLWELFELSLRFIKKNSKKLYKLLLKFLPGYIFLREGAINIVGDIVIGAVGLLIIHLIF